MAASFARTSCPNATNKIMTMVEAGMDTDDIALALRESAERKILIANGEDPDEEESFPAEIRLIAQALAFRSVVEDDDLSRVLDVLSVAYGAEVSGLEAFRSGLSISRETLEGLYGDDSYKWLIVEAPNGHHIEADGAILGVCCYSTDGVSRKNGEVEGYLGSIRLFGVLPRYHGLCIGQRLLKRVEAAMFRAGCCRSMICISSPRQPSMGRWVERRGYIHAGSTSYPAQAVGHVLTIPAEEVALLRYIKALETVDGISDSAESKDKKYVSLRDPSKPKADNSDDDDDEVPRRAAVPSGPGMALPPVWRALREQSQRDKAYAAEVAAAATTAAATATTTTAAAATTATTAPAATTATTAAATSAAQGPAPAHPPPSSTPTKHRALAVVDLDLEQIDASSDSKGRSASTTVSASVIATTTDELGMD